MAKDPLSKEQRSERMGRIRSKNTKPELIVRRIVYHSGYRYRLHVKELSGKPDLVFKTRKKIIFVHGCFWHQHQNCVHYRMPHTRLDYWLPKLQNNVNHDNANIETLEKDGWSVLIIWECETKPKELELTARKIIDFLKY